MPTRKQRRRRAKEKRHEWEYVEIDPETGDERPIEPAALKADKKAADQKKPASTRGGRPIREVPPPSWHRALRRAAIFGPIILAVMILVSRGPLAGRILYGLMYALLIIPFMYWTDRMTYRTYQRRVLRQRERKG